ncbi:hypothetical protein GBAR_LOCUS7899 [Geodia barretti]|uniref:Uncharacterized protein n=1 Tax=Geodia barretti TaxID=519541 RepID=A0AA35W8Q0_GEOBA|nr:hypothetical protein GBAR_LOCUS7899 [Geodia barretti]
MTRRCAHLTPSIVGLIRRQTCSLSHSTTRTMALYCHRASPPDSAR